MAKQRPPHPAYFDFLYLQLAVGAACVAILFAIGQMVGALLLLVAAGTLFLVLRRYRAKTQGQQQGPDA